MLSYDCVRIDSKCSEWTAHVKDFIPIRVQSLLDHRRCSGLFSANGRYSEGIRKACTTWSVAGMSSIGVNILRNTSLLYSPSAAMTDEVRLARTGIDLFDTYL